ncbi:hypothetical protein GCM10023332_11450 [Luteimonas vadosa]|uniref:Uncharacterized protein n=1 Tax=Luteimonas vadosa TaxID=1165507 RepID=A0ABP9E2H1_9GAMM
MATGLKASRSVVLILAYAAAAVGLAYVSLAPSQSSLPVADCVPVPPDVVFVGPTLSVSQVESASLKKMAGTPTAPQVPFGYMNYEWLRLKELMLRGDSIRQFKTDVTGGHMVLRGKCVVGQSHRGSAKV